MDNHTEPLPPTLVTAMRAHCADADSFSVESFVQDHPEWAGKLSYHDCDGPPPGEAGTFDAYALMAAVSDEFEFTEDGWDNFLVDTK